MIRLRELVKRWGFLAAPLVLFGVMTYAAVRGFYIPVIVGVAGLVTAYALHRSGGRPR
jgi:hypothetical protein